MTKIKNIVINMKKKQRIQLVISIMLTVVVIISIPTLAWFNHQKQIAELQAIKTPDLLYISAANAECVKYFNLSTLDVTKDYPNTETRQTSQLYPFCVAGEYVSNFTLQLAHTTNNPFTYKIYEGIAYTDPDAAETAAESRMPEGGHIQDYLVEYTIQADWNGIDVEGLTQRASLSKGQKLYIVKGECLDDGENSKGYKGGYLNMSNDGRTADYTYHDDCYDNGDGGTYDNRTKYSEPLYWQCANIKSVDESGWGAKPFMKTFVFEVSWPSSAQNNKETDMIYISAYRGNDS